MSPVGICTVETNWKIHEEKNDQAKRYLDKVLQYCNDGCFDEMMAEYLELLKNEYDHSASLMAGVVKRLMNLQVAEPKVFTRTDTKNGKFSLESFEIKGTPVDNLFAVGLFSEKANGDAVKRMRNIKNAFNSPFWPFVFTTTSIGTEVIDLHWYARNAVHWSIPSRPIDLEQREGRILRFNCHAYRLNAALKPDLQKERCVKDDWKDSGLFECQLNFSVKRKEIRIIWMGAAIFFENYIFISTATSRKNIGLQEKWFESIAA